MCICEFQEEKQEVYIQNVRNMAAAYIFGTVASIRHVHFLTVVCGFYFLGYSMVQDII
jgi:hypothetical protein